MITQMRNQFVGNAKGLQHLEKLLDSVESSLREKIKEQEEENRAK